MTDAPAETGTHGTAYVDDLRLHYVTAGDPGDPAVVLLHGWPQTWYEWRHVIDALADDYRVLAPDMRGLGDSARPRTGYDKRTIAADVRGLVSELGQDRVSLVGHDWGMPVAYAYASRHPDEVASLAVLDGLLPGVGDDAGGTLPSGAPVWHFGLHMTPNLPEALVSGRERTYLSWFFRELAYDPLAIDETAVDEYVRCYSEPGALRAGFEYYRAAPTDAAHNREHAERPLELPVLALGGRSTFAHRTVETMETVAEDVRGDVVDRCGHWIPEERPDRLVEELDAFLGAVT